MNTKIKSINQSIAFFDAMYTPSSRKFRSTETKVVLPVCNWILNCDHLNSEFSICCSHFKLSTWTLNWIVTTWRTALYSFFFRRAPPLCSLWVKDGVQPIWISALCCFHQRSVLELQAKNQLNCSFHFFERRQGLCISKSIEEEEIYVQEKSTKLRCNISVKKEKTMQIFNIC